MKKEVGKKGQVILFVLIGMIVLGAFAFIFTSQSGINEQKTDDEIKSLTSDIISAEKIQFRVQKCLEKGLDSGLRIIGKQGGYIFSGQPGGILPWELPTIEVKDGNISSNVTYRIEKNARSIPPQYPCPTSQNGPRFCGFVNSPDFKNLYKFTFGRVKPLHLFNTSSFYSIENMLNSYVNNSTLECLNLSQFVGYNITSGNITSSIRINDQNVVVSMDFPISIKVQGKLPVIEKVKFSSNERVRLQKLHDAINEVLTNDNKFLNYDLKEDTIRGRFQNKRMQIKDLKVEVNVIYNAHENDDVIQIIDRVSSLSGKPFVFQFARQNRPPVLNLIKADLVDSEKYEFILSPGDELEIKPVAGDPDEDELVYDFVGWKENELKNSALYTSSGNCNKRCAKILLTDEDNGDHVIKVSVSDGQYEDSQEVRVKVISDLDAKARVRNLYDDTVASIEDPFYLDGSETLVPYDDIKYDYVWSYRLPDGTADNIRNLNGVNIINNDCLVLPLVEGCVKKDNLDIRNMLGFFDVPGIYNLTMKVSYSFNEEQKSDTDQEDIVVQECIPHRNEFVPVYPFQNAKNDGFQLFDVNDNLDLFKTNHTCCKNDGSMYQASDEKVCYEVILDKCGRELVDGNLFNLIGGSPVTELTTAKPAILKSINDLSNPITQININSNLENTPIVDLKPPGYFCDDADKCVLKFTQYCSGNRGNVCSGKIVYQQTDRSVADPGC